MAPDRRSDEALRMHRAGLLASGAAYLAAVTALVWQAAVAG